MCRRGCSSKRRIKTIAESSFTGALTVGEVVPAREGLRLFRFRVEANNFDSSERLFQQEKD